MKKNLEQNEGRDEFDMDELVFEELDADDVDGNSGEEQEYYGEEQDFYGEEPEFYEEEQEYYGEEPEFYEEEQEYYGEEPEFYEEGREYCGEEQEYYGEEPEFYEEEPEFYEDMDYDEEEYERQESSPLPILAWFANMSAMDRVTLGAGAAILLLAIIMGIVFVNTSALRGQKSELATVGTQLEGINIVGDEGLLAVADARAARVEAAKVLEQEEKDYNETEYNKDITVTLKMVSVQKDLKIKFVNKDSDRLILNVPFSVSVITADNKTETWTDDDMDGIIYKKGITPGNYQVSVNALEGDSYKGYTLPADTQKVEVKKDIAYKKVDVSDEVKTEAQVDLSKEEQRKPQITVESALTDTVEWVESTVIASTYIEVSKSSIPDPMGIAASGNIMPVANRERFRPAVAVMNMSAVSYISNIQPLVSGGDGQPGSTPSEPVPSEPLPAEPVPSEPLPPVVEQPSVSLDKSEVTLYAGESAAVQATLGNTSQTAVVAQSSDENVAAVRADGTSVTITGVNAGTATVTVSVISGENIVSAACTVTVKNDPRNDTSTLLKDDSGNELFVQEGDSYRNAVVADYYTDGMRFFKKGEAKYTGWQTIDNNVYFFDKSGNKVTGEQIIQGAKYTFASDGALVTGAGALGIDVSKYNGSIDWNAVKNSGVSYVIIRCGYRGYTQGSLIIDPKFETYIKGATAAGLKVGVYFFSQAVDEVEAVEEASFVLDCVKNYRISCPVFLDVEYSGAAGNKGRADGLSRDARTAVCRAFCETIRSGGYTAGIYANKSWLETMLDPGQLSAYKIWLAQYAASPTYAGRYDMWQYKSTGRISGISGNVDMNLNYTAF